MTRRVAVALVLCLCSPAPAHVQRDASFAERIAQLSEPGGYFDTDNLISNERSYLHVLPDLRAAARPGGVYIGVGPDQNFSYIAAVRPSLAFIVDIRRDNLLLHLFFKALFTVSATRIEYLCALFACAPPADLATWKTAPVSRLVDYIEKRPSAAAVAVADTRRVEAAIRAFGVPLAAEDYATIHRFHGRFIDEGVDLKFNTTGRAPQFYYPTYRQLLLETDRSGKPGNFLAEEESYAFVRSLQTRDLIIPVVGDLAGPSALAAIAKSMTARGQSLSAFYASNVELYLFQQGSFERFVANLRRLPHSAQSMVIRAVFGGYAPVTDAGYGSVSQVQRVDELLDGHAAGRYRRYAELVDR